METKEKVQQPPDLSNEDFGKLLIDVIKAVARENVNSSDQLESLLIAMVSCAVASGVGPEALLLFVAKGIVTVSGIQSKAPTDKKPGTEKSSDFDAILGRLPSNSLKN